MKFTFKTDKSTGRYRSFFPDWHYIKYNKKEVGEISDKAPHTIRLMVEKDGDKYKDDNPNCSWIWIKLKKESDTILEAKTFLNDNIDAILAKGLHLSED